MLRKPTAHAPSVNTSGIATSLPVAASSVLPASARRLRKSSVAPVHSSASGSVMSAM